MANIGVEALLEETAVSQMATPKIERARSQRDDAMVTARVDRALKNRGMAVLREIGATPTELVNRAFEYVVATGELPQVPLGVAGGLNARRITPQMRESIDAFVGATTFTMPEDFFADDYDTLLEEALREKYESLA